jgi:hypothetical protein
VTTKKTKTKAKRGTLNNLVLSALGAKIAHELAPVTLSSAAAQGISLPLDYDNLLVVKQTSALECQKKLRRQWDSLSWDRQDAFWRAWSEVMRSHGIVH